MHLLGHSLKNTGQVTQGIRPLGYPVQAISLKAVGLHSLGRPGQPFHLFQVFNLLVAQTLFLQAGLQTRLEQNRVEGRY